MFLRISLAVVLLDQVTKYLIWMFASNTNLIGDVLRISLVKNTGAAFGILPGARGFFILASLVASIVLVYYYLHTDRSRRFKRVLIAVIFGGAVGNLIDRVLMGEVRDFIDIGIGTHRWPVFNVADMAVSLGALSLAIFYLREGRETGECAASGADDSPDVQGGVPPGGTPHGPAAGAPGHSEGSTAGETSSDAAGSVRNAPDSLG